MSFADRVQMVVQEFLAGRPEDAARLQGKFDGEWNQAYFRCLEYVIPRVPQPDDWHERLAHRMRVVECVRNLLGR